MWTTNLSGLPELDEHGIHNSYDEAKQDAWLSQLGGMVEINLIIFSYDPTFSLTLAPSDRSKVLFTLTKIHFPPEKSWVALQLYIRSPSTLALMGEWSLSRWIGVLVRFPIAIAWTELRSLNHKFTNMLAFLNTLKVMLQNFDRSPLSSLDIITASQSQEGLQNAYMRRYKRRKERADFHSLFIVDEMLENAPTYLCSMDELCHMAKTELYKN